MSNILIEGAWKHLYRQPSDYILHSAILNGRFDYMREYLERGQVDINMKEPSNEWTPLHCAAFIGNTKYMKFLLQRPFISIDEKNDEGKTPVQLAIEAGKVFGEENACTCLLERGCQLEDDIWHKLLILALNYDLVIYPQLALKNNIPLHNCYSEVKISLHKVVCCQSLKILRFFGQSFPQAELEQMIKEKDFQGLTVLDYARLTDNLEIIDLVKKMLSGASISMTST